MVWQAFRESAGRVVKWSAGIGSILAVGTVFATALIRTESIRADACAGAEARQIVAEHDTRLGIIETRQDAMARELDGDVDYLRRRLDQIADRALGLPPLPPSPVVHP